MANTRLLRIKDVCERTSLSRASIYNYLKRGAFPEPVRLGPRCIRWESNVIEAWIASHLSGARR